MVGRLIPILIVLICLAAPARPAAAQINPEPSPCATAVAAAIAQRGDPYVWGAKGPNAFDCSGLTSYAWNQAGYNIGPSTYDQARAGVAISCRLSDLAGASTTCWEPGDLIFLRYAGGQHVAIYVGSGLFADAYNPQSGVIVHAVEDDSFYQANFWQARRIVDCEGDVDPPTLTPDSPLDSPALEEIPDVIGLVSFSVPQCGLCNIDGTTILPFVPWSGSWPTGFSALDLPLVFRTVISWLAWQISEIIRQLLCWLLSMLGIAANIFAGGINVVITGLNSLFKMLVLLWLSMQGWFLAAWLLFEEIRVLIAGVSLGGLDFSGLAEWFAVALEAIRLVADLIGQIISLIGSLAVSVIGLIGWVGGFAIGLMLEVFAGMAGTTTPVQLSGEHIIYRATRGTLEGVRDSAIGWVFPVLWGLAYVGFVVWLNRFFSASEAR